MIASPKKNDLVVFINCYEEMATGMRLLAALAKDKGFDVHIIVLRGYKVKISGELDEQGNGMHILVNGEIRSNPLRSRQFTPTELEFLRIKLEELKPELVCVSTRSANDSIMPGLLQAIKEAAPEVPLVCGGYGPTYAPELYLRNGADVVVRGEGELAFATLLDNLKEGKNLKECPGACHLEADGLACKPMAAPLADISHLPSPLVGDKFVTFIDEDASGKTVMQERDPAYDNKIFCVLVGRGCIGRCSYCAAPVQKRMYEEEGHFLPAYRRRSYEQVLHELEKARDNGIKKIIFKDEYLVDDPATLTEFFRSYKERIALPFRANLHFGQLLKNPDLLKAVLDAGLENLVLGFQAGSEEMARKVYGRPHSFDDLIMLAGMLYADYVPVQYHFVSGTSLNTEEEFASKCRLISRLPFDPLLPWRTELFDFQFYPQPGSRLTMDIGEGRLLRKPVREWGENALTAQLFHVAPFERALYIWEEAKKQGDKFSFLLHQTRTLRKQAWEMAWQALLQRISGHKLLIMGEATGDFLKLQADLKSHGVQIAAKIGFPGFPLSDGRTAPEKITENFETDIPILFFGIAAYRFIRVLKRYHGLKNPLYGVAEFFVSE